LISFLVLALGNTAPLWFHLDIAVPGDIGDPLLNAWILAWDAHALLHQPNRLFDANIFFPLPNTLAYSEHLLATALLAMPLQVASGQPLLTYNVTLLVSFALSGLGMYLLCLQWTGRRIAALVAGLAYAFAPYRLASISHLQLLTVQWLPLSLLALDHMLARIGQGGGEDERAKTENRDIWKALVLFGVFTLLQVLSSWYLAVFSAAVLVLYLLTWTGRYGWRRMRRALAWLLCAGGVVTLVVTPVALPYFEVLPHLEATRPAEVVSLLGARPSDFLAAAPWMRLAGPLSTAYRERPGFTEEHMLYPGLFIALLTLSAIGLFAYRVATRKEGFTAHWRAGVLILILLIAWGLTIDGPYRELAHWLPSLRVIRAPARWMVVVTCAMAGLVGYALAWLEGHRATWPSPSCTRARSRARRVLSYMAPALLAIGIYAESFAVPLPLAHVGNVEEMHPVYRALRRLTLSEEEGRGAVLELPMYVAPAPEYPEARRMLASCLGWWQLVNGYSGFTPARQLEWGSRLARFPSAEALATLRDLGRLGVRYLIVHTAEAPFDPARWQATERHIVERTTTLLPLGDFGPDSLYLINPHGDALIRDPQAISEPFWAKGAPLPLSVTFEAEGAALQLLAYRLDPVLPEATLQVPWARALRLTLYWQASRASTRSYTVFVHAFDRSGALVGQADAPPVANQYPTHLWRPGEIVQDSRLVPQATALRIGLYDAATGQRLSAFGPDGRRLEQDAVLIRVEE
jgi:hypothetical protein